MLYSKYTRERELRDYHERRNGHSILSFLSILSAFRTLAERIMPDYYRSLYISKGFFIFIARQVQVAESGKTATKDRDVRFGIDFFLTKKNRIFFYSILTQIDYFNRDSSFDSL